MASAWWGVSARYRGSSGSYCSRRKSARNSGGGAGWAAGEVRLRSREAGKACALDLNLARVDAGKHFKDGEITHLVIMELLNENFPHLVPEDPETYLEFDEVEEEAIVTESRKQVLTLDYGLLTKIENNVLCGSGTDYSSVLLCPMFLRAVKLENPPDFKMAVFFRRVSEFVEACDNFNKSAMEYDISQNGDTEEVEREWQAVIKNDANLQEFWQGKGNNVYLESRKITLPQGAALILKYWQGQLNGFVTRLALVSSDPNRAEHQKAPNFKLYNSPRSVKPGRKGMTEVKTLMRFPALKATGDVTSIQRQPIPELAASFSKMAFTGGVDTFDQMTEANVVFKGFVTGAERDRMKKAELWRPGQL